MERWIMYCKIQSMRSEGFTQRQVAKITRINRNTVRKYWDDMIPDEYDELILTPSKKSSLEQHKEQILTWLRDYPGVTAAQIYDWLQERYQITLTEGSIRKYVKKLRIEYDIKEKEDKLRDYQSVEDPPMGYQMQVDIGITSVFDVYNRKYKKLYCIGFVLSNSRHKYGVWFDRPPKAQDMVQAIYYCFEWMGGKPKELVFDQDRLIAVDENYGDIIYTKEFEKFRQEEKLKIYLCRKGDPESKGRVEAVVKFFKGNFTKYRQFIDIRTWEEEFEAWLDRTGNKKVHSITKKIPAEVFEIERKYLTPVPKTKFSLNQIITRAIRKDNTVLYEGNRYTVPLGTFNKNKEVSIEIKENELHIYDLFGDVLIASHELCKEKGKLIRNNHHLRNNETKISELLDQLAKCFKDYDKGRYFLEEIRRHKSRYIRDQYKIIEKTLNEYSQEAVTKALDYCLLNELISAVDFRDAASYFESNRPEEVIPLPPTIVRPVIQYTAQKRDIDEYTKKLLGGKDKWLN